MSKIQSIRVGRLKYIIIFLPSYLINTIYNTPALDKLKGFLVFAA